MQLIKYRSFLLILKIMGAVSAVGVAFDVWTHNAYSALVFFMYIQRYSRLLLIIMALAFN